LYDLFAVNNHYGPMGHGHYNAHAYNSHANDWWLLDDQTVTKEIFPERIITEAAYLLFYKKRTS